MSNIVPYERRAVTLSITFGSIAPGSRVEQDVLPVLAHIVDSVAEPPASPEAEDL